MAPVAPGSATARAHVNSQFDYVRVAHRFEGGNPNFLGIRVLRAGARLLESIGLATIEARIRALSQHCIDSVKRAGLRTTTPYHWDERAHIVNVVVPNAQAIMDELKARDRIIINVKDDALRLSMSFFNDESDIDRTVAAIVRSVRR